MIDHVVVDQALDAGAVGQIRGEMEVAPGDPATVLGPAARRTVVPSARKATQVAVAGSARALVAGLLEQLEPRIESRFGRRLEGFEEPQFLRYGPGDYFVAHQDGATPLLHDDTRFRKVSVVIFLSAPETYSGGALVLHPPFGQDEPPRHLAPAPGTLVAFPSETTHEVLPITHGERLSVVSWYRG